MRREPGDDLYVVMASVGREMHILAVGDERIDIVDAIYTGVKEYEYVWVEHYKYGALFYRTEPINEWIWKADRGEVGRCGC
jgi:hypothetical protein